MGSVGMSRLPQLGGVKCFLGFDIQAFFTAYLLRLVFLVTELTFPIFKVFTINQIRTSF